MRKHRQNWLDIFSGFRVALDARKIILGTLGVYVTLIVLLGLLSVAARWWPEAGYVLQGLRTAPVQTAFAALASAPGRLCGLTCNMADPATCSIAMRKAAFLAGGGVLYLFIWAFFGGAITRIAAVDFAKDERVPMSDATDFAAKKFGSFFWAPVVPLIFALIFFGCNVLLGLVGRIPGVGPILLGIFFSLAVLSSFLIVLLLIGTLFGVIFMWPTIAMEGTDAFDAISRAFNYLYARPWKTLWCCLAASAYGAAVIAFVAAFAGLLLRFSVHGVALGMGDRFAGIGAFVAGGMATPDLGAPDVIAMILIQVVKVTVCGLVLGFIASYKLSAMTITYAVLRRDVDGTDMSEVFLPETEEAPKEPPAEPPATEPAPAEPPPEAGAKS